jgi:uncharacterized protein YcnI
VSRRGHTIARASGWAAATVVVTLFGRMLAYALQPGLSPDGRDLAAATGGPSVWGVALAAIALAVLTAVTVVWLASLAVTERQRLEPTAVSASPGISVGAVAARAALLFAASSVTFVLLESVVHWHAGLGWHGIHCLLGPVHRDALPLLAGLSLAAAAIVRACSHLLAWMRRIIQQLTARTRLTGNPAALRPLDLRSQPHRPIDGVQLGARGPPRPSLPVPRAATAVRSPSERTFTQMTHPFSRQRLPVLALAAVAALVVAAGASAHAIVSPPVAKEKVLQQFTLSVPTEKEGATTTTVELTVPDGFAIDSFEPSPTGWKRQVQSTGSGESAVVQKVTWTGGSVPTGEDSVFRFNASTDAAKTYTFTVRQTYSDGTVVDWNGAETSDTPAPTVESLSSFGGGSSNSTLAIVAIVLGGIALVVALVALISGRGRSLA